MSLSSSVSTPFLRPRAGPSRIDNKRKRKRGKRCWGGGCLNYFSNFACFLKNLINEFRKIRKNVKIMNWYQFFMPKLFQISALVPSALSVGIESFIWKDVASENTFVSACAWERFCIFDEWTLQMRIVSTTQTLPICVRCLSWRSQNTSRWPHTNVAMLCEASAEKNESKGNVERKMVIKAITSTLFHAFRSDSRSYPRDVTYRELPTSASYAQDLVRSNPKKDVGDVQDFRHWKEREKLPG